MNMRMGSSLGQKRLHGLLFHILTSEVNENPILHLHLYGFAIFGVYIEVIRQAYLVH